MWRPITLIQDQPLHHRSWPEARRRWHESGDRRNASWGNAIWGTQTPTNQCLNQNIRTAHYYGLWTNSSRRWELHQKIATLDIYYLTCHNTVSLVSVVKVHPVIASMIEKEFLLQCFRGSFSSWLNCRCSGSQTWSDLYLENWVLDVVRLCIGWFSWILSASQVPGSFSDARTVQCFVVWERF